MTEIKEDLELLDTKREDSKSAVRRWVTYLAAGYVFLGAGGLIVAALTSSVTPQEFAIAKDVYVSGMSIASMVIGWWFAKRDEERR